MGFSTIMNDICQRHDDWERNIWSKITLPVKVVIAPILIIPYVLFEAVTFLIFTVPYTMLEYLLTKRNGSNV